jgi:hypothetical protein
LRRRLPHIIAYRVKDDAVEILHIWHPAQDSSQGISGRPFERISDPQIPLTRQEME